jgi:hypothetical protein
MSTKGFGKPRESAPERPPSGAKAARDAAAERLDSMRQQGLPEFSVWVRLLEEKETPDAPDFPWLPVGSICVPRSGNIEKAIFDVEEDLMKGVYKLFPNMKGKEDQLQFGWQNKEFTDEDIRVAVRPSAFQSVVQKLLGKLPKLGN